MKNKQFLILLVLGLLSITAALTAPEFRPILLAPAATGGFAIGYSLGQLFGHSFFSGMR